jgi:histidinol phosphatase-like enzyme
MKKAIFLDRDGVINCLVERGGQMVSPRKIEDFELLPNVHIAIEKLKQKYPAIYDDYKDRIQI